MPSKISLDSRVVEIEKALDWLPKRGIYVQKFKTKTKHISAINQNEITVDDPDQEKSLVKVIKENYKGYKILLYNGYYYAISKAEKTIDIQNIDATAPISPWKKSSNKEEIVAFINLLFERPKSDPNTPTLYLENYNGYNIVAYKGLYHAINQREGNVDLGDVNIRFAFPYTKSPSSKKILKKIDRLIKENSHLPIFAARGIYKSFKLYTYKGNYYALDSKDKLINDLRKIKSSKYKWFEAKTEEEIKKLADRGYSQFSNARKFDWFVFRVKNKLRHYYLKVFS